MRKNVQQVVNAFIEGQAKFIGPIGTCEGAIYSYQMKIAQKTSNKRAKVVESEASPSRTTSQHINGLLCLLTKAGWKVKRVERF